METFVPTETPFPTETPILTPTVETRIPYRLFGIDFANSSHPVDIQISLPTGTVFNVNSTPVVCETVDPYSSEFTPGEHFGCAYQPRSNSEDVFLFAHSGWFHEPKPDGDIKYIKLETEDLRHWLEDSGGYNPDIRLPLDLIRHNMDSLVGASVEITQSENTATDLKILAVVRVPPDKLGPFVDVCPNIGASQSHIPEGMSLDEAGDCVGTPTGQVEQLTNEDIMATLAGIDPSVAKFASDGKPQIVVIFCGWHSPEEDSLDTGPQGYYEWSRYAIVIGK
jgi:hypothetical protein